VLEENCRPCNADPGEGRGPDPSPRQSARRLGISVPSLRRSSSVMARRRLVREADRFVGFPVDGQSLVQIFEVGTLPAKLAMDILVQNAEVSAMSHFTACRAALGLCMGGGLGVVNIPCYSGRVLLLMAGTCDYLPDDFCIQNGEL